MVVARSFWPEQNTKHYRPNANPFFYEDDDGNSGLANLNTILFVGYRDQTKRNVTFLDISRFLVLRYARHEMEDSDCRMAVQEWANSNSFSCPAELCKEPRGFILHLDEMFKCFPDHEKTQKMRDEIAGNLESNLEAQAKILKTKLRLQQKQEM
eukprot:gnl/MRDRNA2_/MRDRNA2_156595_c0_seq1.p1 gnl/MRDRNA2_/MRDRNA2_156595_c0~~gnl/MRDRNA2_/MRDRNA2_156595_c0_seq1.p1  ORF type:complete len:169 (+),score=28.91 gnl/MRDRNA2_/MRDRNA2_156595_c0_seq1:46-507(+)